MFIDHVYKRVILYTVLGILAILLVSYALFRSLHNTQTQSERNAQAIEQIQAVLVTEKVCSMSHQGDACRALFNRLAISLSKEQKERFVCDGLAALKLPEADVWHKKANCPPPLPSPP